LKPDYPILLLHSQDDEMIGYDHSQRLADEYDCRIHPINGGHNTPLFCKKEVIDQMFA
jgi:predicted esterase